jgi:replicative DNA helicase
MLVSGVNFVSADPAGVPTCDCDGLLTDTIVGSASATTIDDQPTVSGDGDGHATTTDEQPRFPQMVDGATFVLNAPEQPPAIWGFGDDIIWSEGESLMIVGPPGVGKTTLCGQVVRARLTGEGSVLGYGVTGTSSRVLYLAMDRPAQIQRSLRRHFSEDDRQLLADKLVVWKGPPPADVAKNTSVILSLAKLAGADTVVVDSVKDAAIGLSNDEVGAAYNQARQHVLAAGIQMLELHHLVKRGPNGAKPTQLADV